jgi:hypothetical protein
MPERSVPRYRVEDRYTCVDIRLRSVQQLFDGRDPAPFRERDLDEDAADYLSAAAEEIPAGEALKIVLWLESLPGPELSQTDIADAIHSHFEHDRSQLSRQLRQQRRFGRLALALGITVLVLFLTASQLTRELPEGPVREIMREGLVITGWVAMWRPLEVLLYDWWPLHERRRLLSRIIDAPVEVRQR